MSRDIVISIINYRTADLTIACAQSVLDDMDGIDAELVIVDNASGDGSDEAIETWIEKLGPDAAVRLIRSATNSGFSGGHNQAIAATDSAYVLLLNSDAMLRPGFLTTILAGARTVPEAGFVVPRLESEDGEVQANCFRFPGPISEFVRGANSGPITRAFRNHVVSLGPAPDPALIEWASFACILLKREMIRDIGPMDEGYFLYFEDSEYCLRGHRAGWRLHYVPAAVAVHFRGGSGPVKKLAQARKRLPPYFYSSRTRFLYQAYGRSGLWAANVLWLLGRGIAGGRRLLGRKHGNLIQAEARDIWTNVMSPLGPRNAPGE